MRFRDMPSMRARLQINTSRGPESPNYPKSPTKDELEKWFAERQGYDDEDSESSSSSDEENPKSPPPPPAPVSAPAPAADDEAGAA